MSKLHLSAQFRHSARLPASKQQQLAAPSPKSAQTQGDKNAYLELLPFGRLVRQVVCSVTCTD